MNSENTDKPSRKTKGTVSRSLNLLGISISLLLLFLIARRLDFSTFITQLARIHVWPFLPAILVYFVGVLFRALRWQILLSPVKRIPWLLSYKIIALGYMANNVLPLRAGEFYRAYVLGKQQDISGSAVFSSIMLERVFDGIAMLIFLALLLPTLSQQVPYWVWVVIRLSTIVFGSLIIFFLLLSLYPERAKKLISPFISFFPSRVREVVQQLFENVVHGLESLRGPRDVVGIMVTSLLAWMAEAGMYYFLTWSFNTLQISYGGALLTVALVNLGIMVPSAPAYVGPFEFFTTHSLVLLGASFSIAVNYSLILHLLLFFPITAVGYYYFVQMGLKPELMRKA